MQPSPRDIDELDTVTGPTSATSIVEFDFGISPLPGAEAKAGDENDVHSDLRKLIASKDQVDALFRPDGVIEHTCDGVCDPE